MGIIDDMRKQPRLESRHLRNEMDENGILRHIKGNAQPHVAAALDEHAVQPSVRHVPQGLKGTGLQGHVGQVFNIPQGYDHAPILRIGLQLFQELIKLFKLADLIPVRFAYGTVGTHPFIPNMAVHLL